MELIGWGRNRNERNTSLASAQEFPNKDIDLKIFFYSSPVLTRLFFWFYIELEIESRKTWCNWHFLSCFSWRWEPWPCRCRLSSAGWSITAAREPAPPAAPWAPARLSSCAAPSPCPLRAQMWVLTIICSLSTMLLSQVDVEVTWKVLTDSSFQPACETEFDLAALRRKGHLPLVCITIPARVQVPRG